MSNIAEPAFIAAIRAGAERGLLCAEIARVLRTKSSTIMAVAKANKIAVRQRSLKAEASIRMIPDWVPDFLRADYYSDTKLYGEEIAARNARRYKREAGL